MFATAPSRGRSRRWAVLAPGAVLWALATPAGSHAQLKFGCNLKNALTYDQINQRSLHNAYTLKEALLDQLIYYRLRNLELDLRADPVTNPLAGASDVAEWHVYHAAFPGQEGRGVFSAYLRAFRAFHDAVPEHEVVQLTLEFKGEDLGSTFNPSIPGSGSPVFDLNGAHRTPQGLDGLFASLLGVDNIFTPADLMARCPGATTLQEAVATCGWPTLAELRGKFILTIHEFNAVPTLARQTFLQPRLPHPYVNSRNYYMHYYTDFGAAATSRLAFIAPLFLWKNDTLAESAFESLEAVPYAVFHTELKEDAGEGLEGFERALEIRANPDYSKLILRSADTGADPVSFAIPQMKLMNFVLTDKLNWHADPWARTHNDHLYPFCSQGVSGSDCWDGTLEHPTLDLRERQHLLELRVLSGDIDGSRDNCVFAYEANNTKTNTNWSAFVSVASNSDIRLVNRVPRMDVQEHAKGCLMVRASTLPGAPYFAVARHGDDQQLFAHYRVKQDGATFFGFTNFPYSSADLHGEDATFIRLKLVPSGTGVLASGEGSMDGKRWRAIPLPNGTSQQLFPAWLPLQGIAASSLTPTVRTRDGGAPRFLFGNVTRTVSPPPNPPPFFTATRRYYPWSLPGLARIGDPIPAQPVFLDHTYPPVIQVKNIKATTVRGTFTEISAIQVSWEIPFVPLCFDIFSHRVGAIVELRSGRTAQNFISFGDARTFLLPLSAGTITDPIARISVFVDVSAASADDERASGADSRVLVPTPLGTLAIDPAETVVAVGERLRCSLTWTVPEGEGWRGLDSLHLRLRDEQGVVAWIRFQETADAPGTLGLVNPRNLKLGPTFVPGRPGKLETEAATVHLTESAVTGPPGRVITLTFELSFKKQAEGRTLDIEAAAVGDDGEAQEFDRGGGVTVLPRSW